MPSKLIPKPAGSRFHRTRRAVAGSVKADDRPRITSMPSRQNISTDEVVITRVWIPVSASMFVERLVLALLWKAADVKFFIAQSVVRLSMTESSFFWPKKAPLRTPQLEGV
jgi:hypothetical protein